MQSWNFKFSIPNSNICSCYLSLSCFRLHFVANSSFKSFFIPSNIELTSSNSLLPIRTLLEMSKMPSADSRCSPFIPRAWRPNELHRSFNLPLAASLGSLTWTEARKPVPILVGQKVKKPNFLWYTNFKLFSSILMPLTKREYTCLRLLPFCIEIMRTWSSSLIQTRNVLLRFMKMPRFSGLFKS